MEKLKNNIIYKLTIFVIIGGILLVIINLFTSSYGNEENVGIITNEHLELVREKVDEVIRAGGTDITPLNFDLTDGSETEGVYKGSARWQIPVGTTLNSFRQEENDIGYWSYIPDIKNSTSGAAYSYNYSKLNPNRNYKVLALVKTDFDRECEINIGMTLVEGEGSNKNIRYTRTSGIKAHTDGWELFEFEFTTGPSITSGKFYITSFSFNTKYYNPSEGVVNNKAPLTDKLFNISSVKILELPKTTREPLKKGDGMVFRGGAGNLDMKIVNVKNENNKITVTSTGTKYVFNKLTNTIEAYQLINLERMVSSWYSSIPLTGLSVKSWSKNEAVLVNDNLTFGVQLDGMLIATCNNKDYNWTLTLTSQIAGKWNRYSYDNLIVIDDYGGFTVNPVVVNGTGEVAQSEEIADKNNPIDFNRENDSTFISNVKPGWQIKWIIRAGEKLVITTFPPREYDWEKSFKTANMSVRANFFKDDNSARTTLLEYKNNHNVNMVFLWDSYKRGYGMTYGNTFIPRTSPLSSMSDADYLARSVKIVKDAGMIPITYMSLFYWYNEDFDEYIDAVENEKNKYQLGGIYFDGIGSSNILERYETIRRVREIFKDGIFYMHNTGKGGGPPLVVADMFIPAFETYADYIYKGETIPSNNITRDWKYVKYVASGYNTSNSIGRIKGDKWTDESGNVLAGWLQKLYGLESNCRNYYVDLKLDDRKGEALYSSIEGILEESYYIWKKYNLQEDFYEKIYYPLSKYLVDKSLQIYNSIDDFDTAYNAYIIENSNVSKSVYYSDKYYPYVRGLVNNALNEYSFKVIFDSDGGSNIISQTINYKGKVTTPSNPNKTGYSFKEWQLNGKTFNFVTPIICNITLKAVWNEVEKPAVSTLKKLLENNGYAVSENLVSKFEEGETVVSVKEKLGDDVTIETDKPIIATGTVIKKDKEIYIGVIKGDLNGDGKINSGDLLQMRRYLLNEVNLNGAYKQAGIIESNEEIKSLDLLRLRQYLLGSYKFK